MRRGLQRVSVTLVAPSPIRRGGGDTWLAGLLTAIDPNQIDLLVVFEHDGELAVLAADAGHRVRTLARAGLPTNADLLRLAVPLSRLLAAENAGMTVHWSPRAHVYGTLARILARHPGPTVWIQHVTPSRFWLHRLASALPADAVVCVSSAAARRQRLLYPRTRAVVLHPGTTCEARDRDATDRRRLGVPEDGHVVALVGRVEPWKGQDLLVRAVSELRSDGVSVHALLIGETCSTIWPQFPSRVRALVAELGLRRHVTFAGHRDDMAAALSACDVVVCASREEGFGLGVVEAMAVGVPVVATRCGGPEDILEDGINGLLVPTEDVHGLAGAIRHVLEDPAMAVRLAAAARRSYAERFTADRSAGAFLRLVRDLAAPGPSANP
jgi:glycosyltransferase involved in cell wall biosynthesis